MSIERGARRSMSMNSREAEIRHLINLGKLKDVWISCRLFTRLSLAATADEYAAPVPWSVPVASNL